ncbi:secreted protein [Melampsora americana]|nr:secreted protein [Melampsora americana]
MKLFIVLAIILQLTIQFGKTEEVLDLELSDSVFDGPDGLDSLQRRSPKTRKTSTKTNKNVINTITCKGGKGTIQDCYACADLLAKGKISCAMSKTCAVVIVQSANSRNVSTIVKMSAAELKYRLPGALDPSCKASPTLVFESKSFPKTVDSSKAIGVQIFQKPRGSNKVEVCDKATLATLLAHK